MSNKIKILTVGGGSGGHISPVAAVVSKLNTLDDDLEIVFWCDKPGVSLAEKAFEGLDVKIEPIIAGKFRRYYHLKWWQHITYGSIFFPNVIDIFKIMVGIIQSFIKMLRLRPSVIFAKGGFVCLPVGLSAKILNIPLVIHDSDTVPGLTNKILAKYADAIATGAPIKYYSYPSNKTVFTGVPISESFKNNLTTLEKINLRRDLELSEEKDMILITGGGLGSMVLNNLALKAAADLKSIQIVLITGRNDYERVITEAKSQGLNNLIVKDFTGRMGDYMSVCDLVVGRAGATAIAEYSKSAKPTIIIPNPMLTGGHQITNARMVTDENAGVVLKEDDVINTPSILIEYIKYLLDNRGEISIKSMTNNMNKLVNEDAAMSLAKIIFSKIKR